MTPADIDIEGAVLGACLLTPGGIETAARFLVPDSFTRSTDRVIFGAMLGLFDRKTPVDLLTTSEALRTAGALKDVGGSYYLSGLCAKTVTTANLEHHVRIVRERHLLRRLKDFEARAVARLKTGPADVFEELNTLQSELTALVDDVPRFESRGLAEQVDDFETYLSDLFEKGVPSGTPTGWPALDRLLVGLQPADLVIVAGRPSMGKTALALALLLKLALRGVPVALFSIEMPARQLLLRLVSVLSGVPSQKIRQADMTRDEYVRAGAALFTIRDLPLIIDDSPGMSFPEIRARARALHRSKGVEVFGIDYLQLIQGTGRRVDSREQEVAQISRGLKALAKDLNVPFVVLSQLNRSVEGRGDKRPQLSDLRESGGLEQDADVVAFVHRPESYGLPVVEIEGRPEPSAGLAEIIVAKQRQGPTGSAWLRWEPETATFDDLPPMPGIHGGPRPVSVATVDYYATRGDEAPPAGADW